jgi:hypothetical protein
MFRGSLNHGSQVLRTSTERARWKTLLTHRKPARLNTKHLVLGRVVDGKAVVFMQRGVASTCMQRSEWQECGNAPNVKEAPLETPLGLYQRYAETRERNNTGKVDCRG